MGRFVRRSAFSRKWSYLINSQTAGPVNNDSAAIMLLLLPPRVRTLLKTVGTRSTLLGEQQSTEDRCAAIVWCAPLSPSIHARRVKRIVSAWVACPSFPASFHHACDSQVITHQDETLFFLHLPRTFNLNRGGLPAFHKHKHSLNTVIPRSSLLG